MLGKPSKPFWRVEYPPMRLKYKLRRPGFAQGQGKRDAGPIYVLGRVYRGPWRRLSKHETENEAVSELARLLGVVVDRFVSGD